MKCSVSEELRLQKIIIDRGWDCLSTGLYKNNKYPQLNELTLIGTVIFELENNWK